MHRGEGGVGVEVATAVRTAVVSDVGRPIGDTDEEEALGGSEREALATFESDIGLESGSDSGIDSDDDRSLACTICNSLRGDMNYYTLIDGRFVCAPVSY